MFVEACEEAGVAAGRAQLRDRRRQRPSATRSSSTRRRGFIAFTGSQGRRHRDQREGRPKSQPGQIWIKRAILEMGGKDVIIVDETADLDDAAKRSRRRGVRLPGPEVLGVLARDRPPKGLRRRCSSRRRREDEGAHASATPRPDERHVGPVDQRAARRRRSSTTSRSARRKAGSSRAARPARTEGYFIQPTVIDDVQPNAQLAQEEIFGPVLAVIRCEDFDEGIAVANDTEYGLTGALYSRDREQIERARARVPRRQPLHQPQVHRRARRRASVRRLQHVRHRLEGRRPRLPLSVHPAEGDLGKALNREGTRCFRRSEFSRSRSTSWRSP